MGAPLRPGSPRRGAARGVHVAFDREGCAMRWKAAVLVVACIGHRLGGGARRPGGRRRAGLLVGAGPCRRRGVHDRAGAVPGDDRALARRLGCGRGLPQHRRRPDVARGDRRLRGRRTSARSAPSRGIPSTRSGPGPASGPCGPRGPVGGVVRTTDAGVTWTTVSTSASLLGRRVLRRRRGREPSPLHRPSARRPTRARQEPALDGHPHRWRLAVDRRRGDLDAGGASTASRSAAWLQDPSRSSTCSTPRCAHPTATAASTAPRTPTTAVPVWQLHARSDRRGGARPSVAGRLFVAAGTSRACGRRTCTARRAINPAAQHPPPGSCSSLGPT